MNPRFLILIILCWPFLYGCSLSTQAFYKSDINQAESFLRKGENAKAAAIYQRLAYKNTSQQNQFRLLAADAFIKANNIQSATAHLRLIKPTLLTLIQKNHFKLLQAQANLSLGHAETALRQLLSIQVAPLDVATKTTYYQSLAFAYSLTGDTLKSVQTLINLDPFIHRPLAQQQHYQSILDTLTTLSTEELQARQPLATNKLSGWMALARLLKLNPFDLDTRLETWRLTYPQHPANSGFLETYKKKYQQLKLSQRPATIAVLLPRSGRYAKAAQVIKAGFDRAYQQAKQTGTAQAQVRYYDTKTNNVGRLYHQAINDGARLVVGPLDKNNIHELMENAELSIPVLALNHVENLSHPNLYQFGLSPIDDAQQIAYKAQRDGYQKALILTANTSKGSRVARYLTQHWQRLGGDVVGEKTYEPDETDFTQVISELTSQASEPSDVVFVYANAGQALLLNPHLQFNRKIAHLPIYTTANVYLGNINSKRDYDLSGMRFCDIPWIFDRVYAGKFNKTVMQDDWNALQRELELLPNYLRLLPLGLDAYHLVTRLNTLKNSTYAGATGRLSLGENNRIMRELFCAKFTNGVPSLINYPSEDGLPDLQPLPPLEPLTPPSIPQMLETGSQASLPQAPTVNITPAPQLPNVTIQPYQP